MTFPTPSSEFTNSPCNSSTMRPGSRRTRRGSPISRDRSRPRRVRPRRRSSYQLKAPIDGIVWRHFVAQDSAVGPQTKLVQMHHHLVRLRRCESPEKYADDIRPGDKVMVRLIGSDVESPGTVEVLSSARTSWERMTRWPPQVPEASRHEIHVIVDLDKGPFRRRRLQSVFCRTAGRGPLSGYHQVGLEDAVFPA